MTAPNPRALAERCINENGDALVGSWDRETFLRIVEERDALARYALDQEAGWQPIATARHMEIVLLGALTYRKRDGAPGGWKIATGFWNEDFENHRLRSPWFWDGDQLMKYELQPTHWRPLPPPPRGAATGDDDGACNTPASEEGEGR